MKVIHILKKIEMLDQDIKDLRKLEKSLTKNKSFTTPIYMSIEKQINIILGNRIKLLELKIENPPEDLLLEIDGTVDKEEIKPIQKTPEKKKAKRAKAKVKKEPVLVKDEIEEQEIPMLLQDDIDEKIQLLEKGRENNNTTIKVKGEKEKVEDEENIKILDVALEKGTLNKQELEKEKKRVKFFKDNFPRSEY
ncbi:MAG: hypothetical protein SVZ03_10530 [Spirochaetota bacterium]|nr:hypothetical protein [Spirochaetota bacterium]